MLGSGAFGKVIKAEAIGIDDFSPRDKSQKKSQRRPKMFRQHRAGHAYHDPRGSAYTKTTVAVKTVKGNVSSQGISLSGSVTFTMEQRWLLLVGGRWRGTKYIYILLLKYCNIRYVFFILCGNKDYSYYYYYY